MAQNISETNNFTTNYDVGVPEQTDTANIVQAFTEYHYGPNYNGTGSPGGMEGHLGTIAQNLTTHASATSAHGVSGSVVGTTSSQTLTNKTLTSPTINSATINSSTINSPTIQGGTFTSTYLIAPEERWNISATAVTSTTTVDYLTAQNWQYTTASTAGACTINIRGNSGTTLSSLLNVGDSITLSVHVATGATTPAFFNAVQVDGTAVGVTVRWQYGTTPTNATTTISGYDMYSFTVIKTSGSTYTVLSSVTKW